LEVEMNAKQLTRLGIPQGETAKLAVRAVAQAAKSGMKKSALRAVIRDLVEDPEAHKGDPVFGAVAAAVAAARAEAASQPRRERRGLAPCRRWGDDVDPKAIQQMENACRLPVSVRGALMPDAHVGYGLPIGGVLATRGAVVPYAVGMDIACRMRLTVLDLPVKALTQKRDRLVRAVQEETKFGVGAAFPSRNRRRHAVMDEDWSFSKVLATHKDKAWAQLGTSGSGNHFVEYGTLTLEQDELGLKAGIYLALLSHSGSRGAGAEVATHYSRVAASKHPELSKELKALAWLDLGSADGREYWLAMELMGRYAAANHELIHRHVVRNLGVDVLFELENHHNFAWQEEHDGEPVVVHRKGATPAAKGVLGVIPGSMATPGYVARGKGDPDSLFSASHGAGRRMSRKAAKKAFSWKDLKRFLAERGVTLLSAGLDEIPMAYKDIDEVMAAQADLVEIVARFDPRLVKMSGRDERPEG